MGQLGIVDFIAIVLLGLGGAAAVLWLVARLDKGNRREPGGLKASDDIARFLFDNGVLRDANLRAMTLLGRVAGDETHWSDLADRLAAVLPALPRTPPEMHMVLEDQSRPRSQRPRMTIEPKGSVHTVTIERAGILEMPAEGDWGAPYQTLFNAASQAPCLMWQTDEAGHIVWANSAYFRLAGAGPATRPIPALFPASRPGEDERPSGPERLSIRLPDSDEIRWLEISSVPFKSTRLHYGIHADAVVKAEVAQRNFVQTLTKTFAQLSIGLAIFDRNRQLALFNPALIDLTALPADFLSARPNLLSFFDRMRENQMMPEPKSYSSWREQMADLVVAAADDRYSETWTLPSGLTYRVTGRPHPDGAVAFLFEDISAEISLTRRFRTEIEIGQSVIDTLDTALAVFSPTGVMSQANQKYKTLWGEDPDQGFGDVTIIDAIKTWESKCHPSSSWERLRDFVVKFGERRAWEARLSLLSGEDLTLSVAPINGGATLVCFQDGEKPGNFEKPVLARESLSDA